MGKKITITNERYKKLNKRGSLEDFLERVSKEVDFSFNELFRLVPRIIMNEKQTKRVKYFIYHYNFQMSIFEMHYEFNVPYSRIEAMLEKEEQFVIDELKKIKEKENDEVLKNA